MYVTVFNLQTQDTQTPSPPFRDTLFTIQSVYSEIIKHLSTEQKSDLCVSISSSQQTKSSDDCLNTPLSPESLYQKFHIGIAMEGAGVYSIYSSK